MSILGDLAIPIPIVVEPTVSPDEIERNLEHLEQPVNALRRVATRGRTSIARLDDRVERL